MPSCVEVLNEILSYCIELQKLEASSDVTSGLSVEAILSYILLFESHRSCVLNVALAIITYSDP